MRFMQTESVLQTKNGSGPAKNRFSVALLGSTVPVENSASLVSCWNGGPSDWDFPISTEHQ